MIIECTFIFYNVHQNAIEDIKIQIQIPISISISISIILWLQLIYGILRAVLCSVLWTHIESRYTLQIISSRVFRSTLAMDDYIRNEKKKKEKNYAHTHTNLKWNTIWKPSQWTWVMEKPWIDFQCICASECTNMYTHIYTQVHDYSSTIDRQAILYFTLNRYDMKQRWRREKKN